MFEGILGNGKFFSALEQADKDIAEAVRAAGCACGGALHRADYARKARGDLGDAEHAVSRRISLCCAVDGCRKRSTPPSLRFLGRKVYAGAIIIAACAVWIASTARALLAEEALLGVSRRTIRRWIAWWADTFASSPFWRATRARFMPAVDEALLPISLVERFTGDVVERVRAALELLLPITTSSATLVMGR